MTKYNVEVNLVFRGMVTVEADSASEAQNKAGHISANLGEVSDSAESDILDWDIDLHPEVEACYAEEGES